MSTSLRSIAEAAGVSVSTVSCALRGLAKVDPQTRAHICAVAQKLGYVRNPQLSHALSFARRQQRPTYRETLVVLVDYLDWGLDQPKMKWAQQMHQIITQRGTELGYKVEFATVPQKASQQKALSRQLHARGIRGLLIMPSLNAAPYSLAIDFSKFACVEIGQTMNQMLMPRVTRDIPGDYDRLFRELQLRGYKRIGLAISENEERRRQWVILASYLLHLEHHAGLPRLPLLSRYEEKTFRKWLTQAKPDVVILNGNEMAQWLRNSGMQIPEEIGLCRIDTMPGEDSGLQPNYTSMARSAINILTTSLERGEIGIPADAPLLYISSQWYDGNSLRPRPTDQT